MIIYYLVVCFGILRIIIDVSSGLVNVLDVQLVRYGVYVMIYNKVNVENVLCLVNYNKEII